MTDDENGSIADLDRYLNIVSSQNEFGLTFSEARVLHALASGLGNKQIACTLGLSIKTVEKHLTFIHSKLGVDCRMKALLAAIEHGLVSVHSTPDRIEK